MDDDNLIVTGVVIELVCHHIGSDQIRSICSQLQACMDRLDLILALTTSQA